MLPVPVVPPEIPEVEPVGEVPLPVDPSEVPEPDEPVDPPRSSVPDDPPARLSVRFEVRDPAPDPAGLGEDETSCSRTGTRGPVRDSDGPAMAYVAAGSGFEPRQISVLRRGRDQVAIAGGLREGERVATKDPEAEGAPR